MKPKLLLVALTILLRPEISLGQDLPDGGATFQIKIVKLSWSKRTPPPRGWDRPLYSAANPSSYDPSRPTASSKGRPRSTRGRRSPYYFYEVTLTNEGDKTVQAIAWDYRISDPSTLRELSLHSFKSYVEIRKDKTITLEGRSAEPPSRVVSIAGLQKDKRSPFIEQAMVKCVIFSDGTLWKNPFAPLTECETLRAGLRRRE